MKKSNRKKIISKIICSCMVISMCNLSPIMGVDVHAKEFSSVMSNNAEERVIQAIQPEDIVVTEGIRNENLPLPHQVRFNTNKRQNLKAILDTYPSKGWSQTKGETFQGQVGEYTFRGTFKGTFPKRGELEFPSNPDDIQPEINVIVKKARVLSFMIPNQVGNSEIDEDNQTINIKVIPGTNISEIYPLVTLSDYTHSTIDNGDKVDFSKGEVQFQISSTRNNHTYDWKVNVSEASIQDTVYIAPNGDDQNDGTKEKPFKTLQKAKDYVRTINKDMTGNIIVYLRGGVYNVNSTLELDESDSGTNGYNVVYRAYPKEHPVLNYGEKVKGWRPVPEKPGMYKASVPEDIDYARELYVNEKKAQIAKQEFKLPDGNRDKIKEMTWYSNSQEGYPKTVEKRGKNYTIQQGYKTNGNFTRNNINFENMSSWKNISDIEFGYREEWTYHIIPVQSIEKCTGEEGLVIKMQMPAFETVQSGIGGSLSIKNPNFIQNAFELLDEPGESYFDKQEKCVYYIPRDGENINEIEAYLPKVEDAILGNGTSDKPIQNITFNGIKIENTADNIPNSSEGAVTGQASFLKTSSGTKKMYGTVKFDNAKNIIFDNCDFKLIGKSALDFNKKCVNNTVIGCTFNDIGSSAIQLGDEAGKLSMYNVDEAAVGNKIIGNKLNNIATSYDGGIGIWLSIGKDTIIANNDIKNAAYSGISTGWSWGVSCPTIASNNIIEYNNVTNVLTKLNDGGGIYTLGYQPGSRIRGNHVHDNPNGAPGGIYLDEGSSGYTDISENVVYNVSKELSHCFYFNRDAGYWENQPEKDKVIEHMNDVMSNNFPHNRFTTRHTPQSEKLNPDNPDMNLDYVRNTIENAGLPKAYDEN